MCNISSMDTTSRLSFARYLQQYHPCSPFAVCVLGPGSLGTYTNQNIGLSSLIADLNVNPHKRLHLCPAKPCIFGLLKSPTTYSNDGTGIFFVNLQNTFVSSTTLPRFSLSLNFIYITSIIYYAMYKTKSLALLLSFWQNNYLCYNYFVVIFRKK